MFMWCQVELITQPLYSHGSSTHDQQCMCEFIVSLCFAISQHNQFTSSYYINLSAFFKPTIKTMLLSSNIVSINSSTSNSSQTHFAFHSSPKTIVWLRNRTDISFEQTNLFGFIIKIFDFAKMRGENWFFPSFLHFEKKTVL